MVRERLKVAQDRQKSYADTRRKDLEFEVNDMVFLKVAPWKGVIDFRKEESSILGTSTHLESLRGLDL